MKHSILILVLTAFALQVPAAVDPPTPYGATPSPAQLAWHEVELYGLICFNMPTFTNEEWAFGDKPATLFNPTDFSADQIVKAAKDGGLKGVILVCKHHGGLCLWPTQTTEYSIRNSPWEDGKGDIVKEIAVAARQHGLKFGAYLSPWDRNNPEYGRPEYVKVYREQWRELMSNYGELFELWIDGANGGTGWYGGSKGRRNIDRSTYYGWDETFKMMHSIQPGAVIFSDIGPGTRWVGNEHGTANDPCWATITFPLVNGRPAGPGSGISRELLGTGKRDGRQWVPAEADVSIRPGWYYHPNQRCRSPQNLITLYFKSIGRGASLNLGLSPDTRGRLHENDVASLKKFGEWQRTTFGSNLAAGAKATASNVRAGLSKYSAKRVIDNKDDLYWCTDDNVKTSDLILDLNKEIEFNILSIREYLPLGQRVDEWALDYWSSNRWIEFARGKAIGSRRLVRSDYITSSKVRLRILKATACPAIKEFTLHREPEWAREIPAPDHEIDMGASKKGWKIQSCTYAAPGGGAAEHAIDSNPKTLWHTHGPDGEHEAPQSISIDMGREINIESFLYLPRRDGTTRAIVDQYEYRISMDGKTWAKAASGEFSNIAANPVQQVVKLSKPAKVRYLKFTALHSANGKPLSAAELGVIEVKEK